MQSQIDVKRILKDFKSHEFYDEDMLRMSQEIQEKCFSLIPAFAEYNLPIDVDKLRIDAMKLVKKT